MTAKTNKPRSKRLSKGQRTHMRRMKQAAQEEGTVYRSPRVHRAPAKAAGE